MDAIILAGAKNTGSLKDCSNSPYEAGIEIAGRPMVELVIEALLKVKRVQRAIVVVPPGILSPELQKKVWKVVSPGETMVDSLLGAFEAVEPDEPVLVVTSDIPLISPEAVDDFLDRCAKRSAEIYYSVVSKEANELKYPGVQRTYVRLKDGTFTGGNIVLINPRVVREHKKRLTQAVALRKQPLKLCRMLGLRFFLKLLLGRLTVREIERRVEAILHLQGAAVISPYPEVGIDVDKPSDLELARRTLTHQLS
jgi:GTP:adenosylcobinamide-phosphate guanylyltransferase